MNVYEAIQKRRTIRKFKQDAIPRELLVSFLDTARLAPTGANMQPIKYIIVDEPEQVKKMFSCVKWAGYISPEGDPRPGEEPVAYIIVLADSSIRKEGYELDIGAAVQSILLLATEQGIGSCWMGAIDRKKIAENLNIHGQYTINTAIALGYPAEDSVAEVENGSIKYWKDEKGTYHIPKRKLEDILFFNKIQ